MAGVINLFNANWDLSYTSLTKWGEETRRGRLKS